MRINNGRSRRFWVSSAPASTAPSCCTASPAAARPRSIFRRFAKSSVTVARRSCWCRKSASRRRRSGGFAAALLQSPCLHSHLSDAERHWHWQQIASGSVEVVIGARSAVFAPTPNLGLIVIDEEHETTFKQETTPRYHARDVARQRAQLENIPLILGSATPTLESWLRVQQGQDTLVSLPKRVERRPLPPVIVVDVRNDPMVRRGAAIGRALEQAIRHVLHDDGTGQIILFLNLRGFSPAIWCRSCGASVKCPDVRRHAGLAQGSRQGFVPRLRLRMRPARLLSRLQPCRAALRGHRHAAARAGSAGAVSRASLACGWIATPCESAAATTRPSSNFATVTPASCWALR